MGRTGVGRSVMGGGRAGLYAGKGVACLQTREEAASTGAFRKCWVCYQSLHELGSKFFPCQGSDEIVAPINIWSAIL